MIKDLFVVYILGKWGSDSVDLTDPGLVEFLRDLGYSSWIILVLALLTDYAFLLLVGIPAYAAYKLFGMMGSLGGGAAAGEKCFCGFLSVQCSSGADDDGGGHKKGKKIKTGPKKTKAQMMEGFGQEMRGGRPKFR